MHIYFILWVIIQHYYFCFVAQTVLAQYHWLLSTPPLKNKNKNWAFFSSSNFTPKYVCFFWVGGERWCPIGSCGLPRLPWSGGRLGDRKAECPESYGCDYLSHLLWARSQVLPWFQLWITVGLTHVMMMILKWIADRRDRNSSFSIPVQYGFQKA